MPEQTHNKIDVQYLPITDLRPDPFNPRKIGEQEMEALTRSIQEFGFIDPILVRREDLTIVGGHQRLTAARRLGMKQVPVVLLDLTPEQAKLLNVALNKIGGEWDDELLARLFKDLEQSEIDLTLSGFGDDDIRDLLKSLESRDKRTRIESFDVDAALEEARRSGAKTQPGDLIMLGDHRLLCGDATSTDAMDSLMAGAKAAMAFTDPPYNVNYGASMKDRVRGDRRTILNDNLRSEFPEFLRAVCANILRIADGAVYICMSSSELHTLYLAFVEGGGHWSTFIIWAKNTFTMGRSDYQRQYEPILYGWREGAKHHWCGDRDQGDVWHLAKPTDSALHPTQKPLELVERAIRNSSEANELVLDPFLGSGTTLIACERQGRVCYGMELGPHYCEVIVARWEAFTGESAVRVPAEATQSSAQQSRA